MTRREFLQTSAAASLVPFRATVTEPALVDPAKLRKFADPLPLSPVARSTGLTRFVHHPAPVPVYRLQMREAAVRVHRDLPMSKVWGFGASGWASTSPGPTIEARCGEPLVIEWTNALPVKHFLPIDHSIHGAGTGIPEVRTIIHLHGGRVPPGSDGYPDNWFTPGKSVTSFYPNRQDATMLWYHDHAMAITRLNMYAGLFGMYILRDEHEDALNLPRGRYEIPLILFDRSFRDDGQLFYPVSPNPAKPWIPEFFGQAVLANGALFPFFETEPRKYRFRMLNASNSRFLYLSLSSGQSWWQIGSDQGLLAEPVELKRLTLAPGERADTIIDFSGNRGQSIVLRSDTYEILQFRVSDKPAKDSSAIPGSLRNIRRMPESAGVKTRLLTLEGGGDPDDPTTNTQPMLLNGAHWHDPVTENPVIDSTEIWGFINVTEDSHPIHLHLVRFQILDRRPFDVFTYLNERRIRYTDTAIPPDANESGWKDTVRADPGMVTRIIVRFEGYAGRYVWHCHVLEHEDYEMMRPYDVLPKPHAAR